MKTVTKSLGEFIASVLGTISGATYIPAAAIVGAVALVGVYESSGSKSPVAAIAKSDAPAFTDLAVLLVVTAIVAAIIEPIQMAVTRAFEGQASWLSLASRKAKHRKDRTTLHDRRDHLDELEEELLKSLEGGISEKRAVEIEKFLKTKKAEAPSAVGVGRIRNLLDHCRYELNEITERCKGYPDSDWRVLGTQLGNALRYYEDTANATLASAGRNGVSVQGCVDLQDLLPVVYFAVPKETREQHDAARSQLNLNTSMLVVLPIIAVLFAGSIGTAPDKWLLWQLTSFVTIAIAWLAAKQAALWAARAYGTMLLAITRQFASGSFSVEADDAIEHVHATAS